MIQKILVLKFRPKNFWLKKILVQEIILSQKNFRHKILLLVPSCTIWFYNPLFEKMLWWRRRKMWNTLDDNIFMFCGFFFYFKFRAIKRSHMAPVIIPRLYQIHMIAMKFWPSWKIVPVPGKSVNWSNVGTQSKIIKELWFF